MIDTLYQIISTLLPFAWTEHMFMKNALIGVFLLTPLLGILSTMVVSNRMAFFSDSLGHAAFTGVAVGFLVASVAPLISLVAFSMVFAILITYIKYRSGGSTDTIIGVFSSTGIALGLILMSYGGNFKSFSSYFIGDLLAITQDELGYLAITFGVVLFTWNFIFNKLLITSVNISYAASRGVHTLIYEMFFACLVAVIVSISIQWVGLLIINSLLILPAAAARNLSNNAKQYHLYSVGIALFSGLSGLIISYYASIATGATIALIAAIIFFISFGTRRYFQH